MFQAEEPKNLKASCPSVVSLVQGVWRVSGGGGCTALNTGAEDTVFMGDADADP